MTTEHDLPPLPPPDADPVGGKCQAYWPETVRSYALAAVESEKAKWRKQLYAFADAAYMRGIQRLRTNECLGWEHKVKTGMYGEAEHDAHLQSID